LWDDRKGEHDKRGPLLFSLDLKYKYGDLATSDIGECLGKNEPLEPGKL
jgi:hypothetical protein